MTIFIIIFFMMITNDSFANNELKKIDENTKSFVLDKIKDLLLKQSSFSFISKMSDIEIKIDHNNLKKIPLSIDEIENLEFISLNKVNSSFKVMVEGNKDNKPYKQEIQGKLVEYLQIPALKKRIGQGYQIEESDIEFLKMDAAKISYDIVLDKSELIGKTPKYSVAPHVVIKKDLIGKINLINKKDSVSVLYKKDNLEVKITAIALDSGAAGDTIRVQNTRSNQILSGVIMDNKVVLFQ